MGGVGEEAEVEAGGDSGVEGSGEEGTKEIESCEVSMLLA